MSFPRKTIQLFALLICLVATSASIKAQTNAKAPYTYYFEVNSIKTKADAKLFEASIESKAAVSNLQGYGFPRAFYILYAKSPVTAATFNSWVKKEWTISKYKPFTVTKESLTKLKTEKLFKKAN
jgi:hypothetical protein